MYVLLSSFCKLNMWWLWRYLQHTFVCCVSISWNKDVSCFKWSSKLIELSNLIVHVLVWECTLSSLHWNFPWRSQKTITNLYDDNIMNMLLYLLYPDFCRREEIVLLPTSSTSSNMKIRTMWHFHFSVETAKYAISTLSDKCTQQWVDPHHSQFACTRTYCSAHH